MSFDKDSFTPLCIGAAVAMGADDPMAAANGEMFIADGVWCQLLYREHRGCAMLICNLGDPDPDSELELYRELLRIQSTFAGNVEAMFIRDPINDTLLFTACMALRKDLDADTFAGALKPLVDQVRVWRDTLLKGHFVDYVRIAEEFLQDIAGSATTLTKV